MNEGATETAVRLTDLLVEHGPLTFFLVLVSLLFWNLIWKVWHSAMSAKDQEIERLVVERDKYQKLVFKNLLSSNTTDCTEDDKE